MAAGEIHVGDTPAWAFQVNRSDTATALDCSAAAGTTTARQLIFRKPDDSVTTQTASLVGAGTSGALTFSTPSGLLDTDGEWKVQLRLELGAGVIRHSDVYIFDVKPNVYP